MQRARSFWAFASVSLACLIASGCGGGSSSVSGTITLNGQPLKGARVSFKAVDSPPGRIEGLFVGLTDDAGRYSLQAADSKSGALSSGKYTASITTTYVEGGVPDGQEPPPERVPAKYRKGIEFEVPEGGTDSADFDLTSK